jgi:hypothetical protein
LSQIENASTEESEVGCQKAEREEVASRTTDHGDTKSQNPKREKWTVAPLTGRDPNSARGKQ